MRAELHVFDKAFAWQGIVGEYDNLTATRCHLKVGDLSFTAPSDLDTRPALAASGAYVVAFLDNEQFVTGRVSDSGVFVEGADITYEVADNFQLLHRILGWSVPSANLSAQNNAYWWGSPTKQPAESLFKAALSANVARLGLPVTVAPDQGRGDLVEFSYRFHPLPDRFLPALDKAGVGVSVTLVEGQGLRVDCYEATDHPITLTSADGVIQGGEWSRTDPTASRVIGMADGEGVARNFYGPLVDAAREAEFGFCGEVAIDTRDTTDPAVIADRMALAMKEHGEKVSVSMQLTESADFSYGVYRVGDRVKVEYTPGRTSTDVLTEATMTHSTGVPEPEVTFQLGERTDDESLAMWRRVSEVAAGVRDLTVR